MKRERALEILAEVVIEKSREVSEKWNKIGRNVGELRKADIVFHPGKGMTEVVLLLAECNTVWVEFAKEDGTPDRMECKFNDVELVTPAEFRFDLMD